MDLTSIPILLLVFRRPDLTVQVLERVRAVRPRTLLVVCDAARANRPDEADAVARTRALFDTHIDWPCEVVRNFADTNMGCGRRVSSGITWAFEQVDRAIVLEDDCLPSPSFFPYCAELLERYADDPRVMSIGGTNFLHRWVRSQSSYFFARHAYVWGWASWRRAWNLYDFKMNGWPALRDSGGFAEVEHDPLMRKRWTDIFDTVHQGKIDTWDYQWTYACLAHGGLTTVPAVNLVRNIGFGDGATHTHGTAGARSLPGAHELASPLVHPASVRLEPKIDLAFSELVCGTGRTGRLAARLRYFAWRGLQKAGFLR